MLNKNAEFDIIPPYTFWLKLSFKFLLVVKFYVLQNFSISNLKKTFMKGHRVRGGEFILTILIYLHIVCLYDICYV